jgi:hypothetical protein
MSSEFVTSFASDDFIRLLHHSLVNLQISQGIANKSLPNSKVNLDVIKVHDFDFASITNVQIDNQATISFLIGKLNLLGCSQIGKIDIIAQELFTISSYNFLL